MTEWLDTRTRWQFWGESGFIFPENTEIYKKIDKQYKPLKYSNEQNWNFNNTYTEKKLQVKLIIFVSGDKYVEKNYFWQQDEPNHKLQINGVKLVLMRTNNNDRAHMNSVTLVQTCPFLTWNTK